MRKMLAVVLMAAMLSGVLTGCSSGKKEESTPQTGQTETEQAEAPEETGGADAGGEIEAIELKVGITTTETAPNYISAERFAETLKEVSGGKITLQLHGDGALGTVAQHFAQLKAGTLDIFVTGTADGEILENGKEFSILCTPFVFNNAEHYKKFLESDLFKTMMEKVESANGVKYVGETAINLPRGLNTKKPVYSVDDVKGLKIRVSNSPIYLTSWNILGANPVTVDGSPYMALEQGLADAQENDIAMTCQIGCAEIANYYEETEYIQQSLGLWFSQTVWDGLNETQKGWIEEALAKSCESYSQEIIDNKDATVAQAVEDYGLTVIKADEMDMDSFRQVINDNIEEIAELQGFDISLYEDIKAIGQ